MYYLLPFRFEKIEDNEILVNEVGDYLITPLGTAQRIAEKKIRPDEELYKDLVASWIISETPIPTLIDNLATRLRTRKSFMDDFTSLHIFVLTLRCNQNCVYCQASSRESSETNLDMKREHLLNAIELMFRSPSKLLTMEFQGGEPSLAFSLLKEAVEISEQKKVSENKDITYVLCTNSVDLTDELLSFCKRYNILISSSLDGSEFLHNQNRGKSDSYAKVISGIQKSRENLGFDRVSALMTTSELSLDYSKEIIDSYINNGFNSIFLRPLNPYGLAADNIDWYSYHDRFIAFYKKTLDYIIDINNNGRIFVEELTALLLRKILTPFPIGFVDLQSPAGIVNSVIVYNHDGFVYASDESRMLAEQEDYTFRLGHVTEKYEEIFYGKKVQEMAQIWATEIIAGCSDCAFQSYCGADPVRNHSTQGDMYGFRPSSFFCKKYKAIIKHLFSLFIEREKEVMPIFKRWISHYED